MNTFNRILTFSTMVACMANLSAAEQKKVHAPRPKPAAHRAQKQVKITNGLPQPDLSGFAKNITKHDMDMLCSKINKAAKKRQGPETLIRDLTCQGISLQTQEAFRLTCLRNMASQTFRRISKKGFIKGRLLFDGRFVSDQAALNGQHKKITQSPWQNLDVESIIRAYYHVTFAKNNGMRHPFTFIPSQAPANPKPQPIPFNLP